MSFKTLDSEQVKKILQNHEDILTPAAQKRNKLYSELSCPTCSSASLTPELNRGSLNEIIPRYYFICNLCDCKFDPHTSLIHRDGVETAPILAESPEDLNILHSDAPELKNPSTDE